MDISELIQILLYAVAIIAIFHWLLKLLARLFDAVDILYNKIKIKMWYPLAIRIDKRKHKDYIEDYFNKLLFRRSLEWRLPIGRVRLEWSDRESIEMDLEEQLLIVRLKYAPEIEKVLAKVALLVAPYIISEHLEAALGRDFARLVSIGIVEDIIQNDLAVLREFRAMVREVYGGLYNEIIDLISRADDTSLYRHIFLYELRKILGIFGSRVDREKLVSELSQLLRIIADLENADKPYLCGYYISLTIVRAGKLDKIMLQNWDPYIEYIRMSKNACSYLQRVYIVSAGKYITRAVESLLKYIEEKIPDLLLVDKFEYRARYYKGRTNIPRLVAIMETKHVS